MYFLHLWLSNVIIGSVIKENMLNTLKEALQLDQKPVQTHHCSFRELTPGTRSCVRPHAHTQSPLLKIQNSTFLSFRLSTLDERQSSLNQAGRHLKYSFNPSVIDAELASSFTSNAPTFLGAVFPPVSAASAGLNSAFSLALRGGLSGHLAPAAAAMSRRGHVSTNLTADQRLGCSFSSSPTGLVLGLCVCQRGGPPKC